MRERKPSLVVTFASATAAMALESYSMAHHLPGRLIPVPREITAGCGLAWKAPPEEQERLTAAWAQAGLGWSDMRILML